MRRILTTGALLTALTGVALPLTGCDELTTVDNTFQVDAAVDAAPGTDSYNPFPPDAAPDAAAGEEDAGDATPGDADAGADDAGAPG